MLNEDFGAWRVRVWSHCRDDAATKASGQGRRNPAFFFLAQERPSLSWVRDEEQRCDVRARQRDVAQIVSIYELLTIGGSRFPELSVKSGVYYGSVG